MEIKVLQRQLYLSTSKYVCNHCGSSRELRLKACEGCYNAYYCNKDCQQSDWNTGGHRDECGRRTTGIVFSKYKFKKRFQLIPSASPSSSASSRISSHGISSTKRCKLGQSIRSKSTCRSASRQADLIRTFRREKRMTRRRLTTRSPNPMTHLCPQDVNGEVSEHHLPSSTQVRLVENKLRDIS